MLILDLQHPPSNNTYYRHARGRHYISPAGIKYRAHVQEYAALHGLKAPNERLHVGVIVFPPDKRVRDLDNLFKGLLDSLVFAGVILDDSLIDRLWIERLQVVKGGKCRVFISTIKGENDYA